MKCAIFQFRILFLNFSFKAFWFASVLTFWLLFLPLVGSYAIRGLNWSFNLPTSFEWIWSTLLRVTVNFIVLYLMLIWEWKLVTMWSTIHSSFILSTGCSSTCSKNFCVVRQVSALWFYSTFDFFFIGILIFPLAWRNFSFFTLVSLSFWLFYITSCDTFL